MINRALFEYITKKSGHTIAEAAEAMGLTPSGLSRRLTGKTEFHRAEMEAWMTFVGADDAVPVFFPHLVADSQSEEVHQ